jgi:serine/threonine-protein kinase
MLTPGARLGTYEIVGKLGAGGMGEVWRARDTRLDREVALKMLPAGFADDPDRHARFEREAKVLASLNHPSIAHLYGLEHLEVQADSRQPTAHSSSTHPDPASGNPSPEPRTPSPDVERAPGALHVLVMELVEGEDLAARLSRGAIQVEEAIPIARQIAEALEAAHGQGIVHRDLKPANVKVRPDGTVKVLDFGLAKAANAAAAADPSLSPTVTHAATQGGLILGTAAYMSPEQARGVAVDKRADIWAFGVVLYEALAGRSLFAGPTVSDTLAGVLKTDIDFARLPESTPPRLRELLRRCLERNPRNRLHDIADARIVLDELQRGALDEVAEARPIAAPPAPRPAWMRALAFVATGAALLLVAAAVMRVWAPAAATGSASRVSRLSIVLPEGDEVASLHLRPLAMSPDGASVVYVGLRGDNAEQLYLRALDEAEPKALAGTEGARSPFFSPDGRWIAFFAKGQLKKVTIGGTALQTLADARDARGGSWGKDGTLYFAPTNSSGILTVPASGGTVTALTQPDHSRGEISHRWPEVVPDGSALVFTIWTGPGPDEHLVVRQSLASGDRTVLVRGGTGGRYVEAGYLLYGRLDALLAVPWRPDQGPEDVVPIVLPELARLEGEGVSDLGVSADGTLAYLAGGPGRLAQHVVWVDRGGNTEALPLPERDYHSVAISPDGRQAVIQIEDGVVGLWLYDFPRQTLAPFATTGGSSQAPVWTPDGTHVLYRGTRAGHRNLYRKAADGSSPEERLTTRDDSIQTPTSVSPDGRWIVFNDGMPALGDSTVWIVGTIGDRQPRQLLQPGEVNGQVSPDGRWIAFQSIASGRVEVYVQPFPGPGPRRQVSVGGGDCPLWSRDGRELYYATPDKLMAVDVTSGPTFVAGTPRALFAGRYRGSLNTTTPYDVTADGRRFLRVRQAQPQRAVTHVDVVLNWFAEFRRVAEAK